jgi:threonine aldolase
MKINLISDTVTKPTPAMMEAMMTAEVGDDVFKEDPSVNKLEATAAKMFGKEAALYCPSGTMTNQIAINVHTQPLDEVICDHYSHVYQYETGGPAFNSGVSMNLIEGTHGKITAAQIEAAIKPDFDWLPRTSLVVLENTCNKGGGSYYTLNEIKPIAKLCKKRKLGLHLDGARLFNALVETGEKPKAVGKMFDTISICLSKGLGAPVGSLLIGNEAFIRKSRRVRKVLGGGMRQSGFIAAAGHFALTKNVKRLKIDNERAKKIGKVLEGLSFVESVRPVKTNIVIFDVKAPLTAEKFLQRLAKKGIQAVPFGPQTVRFVTHLDFTEAMLNKTLRILNNM